MGAEVLFGLTALHHPVLLALASEFRRSTQTAFNFALPSLIMPLLFISRDKPSQNLTPKIMRSIGTRGVVP